MWPVQLLLTLVSLVATWFVRPSIKENYLHYPIGFLIPLVVFGSLVVMLLATRTGKEKQAFVASCIYITGMLVGAVFALYPVVLPASTDPALNLTIYNSAAGRPRTARRSGLVDSGDDSRAGILRLRLPNVPRKGATGRRGILSQWFSGLLINDTASAAPTQSRAL